MKITKLAFLVAAAEASRLTDPVIQEAPDCATLFNINPDLGFHGDAAEAKCRHWFAIRRLATAIHSPDVCSLSDHDFELYIQRSAESMHIPDIDVSKDLPAIIPQVNELCGTIRDDIGAWSAAWSRVSDYAQFDHCENLYSKHSSLSYLSDEDRFKCVKWYRLRDLAIEVIGPDFEVCALEGGALASRVTTQVKNNLMFQILPDFEQMRNHVSKLCDPLKSLAIEWSGLTESEKSKYCAMFENDENISLNDNLKCYRLLQLKNSAKNILYENPNYCDLTGDELSKFIQSDRLDTLVEFATNFCAVYREQLTNWKSFTASEKSEYCANLYTTESRLDRLVELDRLKCQQRFADIQIADEIIKASSACEFDKDALEAKVKQFGPSSDKGEVEKNIGQVSYLCESRRRHAEAWAGLTDQERFDFCGDLYKKNSKSYYLNKADGVKCEKWYQLRKAAEQLQIKIEICSEANDALAAKRAFDELHQHWLMDGLDVNTDLQGFATHISSFCRPLRNILQTWMALPNDERINFCKSRYVENSHISRLSQEELIKCKKWFRVRDASILMWNRDRDICNAQSDSLYSSAQVFLVDQELLTSIGADELVNDVADLCAEISKESEAWSALNAEQRFSYCSIVNANAASWSGSSSIDRMKCRKWYIEFKMAEETTSSKPELCILEGDDANEIIPDNADLLPYVNQICETIRPELTAWEHFPEDEKRGICERKLGVSSYRWKCRRYMAAASLISDDFTICGKNVASISNQNITAVEKYVKAQEEFDAVRGLVSELCESLTDWVSLTDEERTLQCLNLVGDNFPYSFIEQAKCGNVHKEYVANLKEQRFRVGIRARYDAEQSGESPSAIYAKIVSARKSGNRTALLELTPFLQEAENAEFMRKAEIRLDISKVQLELLADDDEPKSDHIQRRVKNVMKEHVSKDLIKTNDKRKEIIDYLVEQKADWGQRMSRHVLNVDLSCAVSAAAVAVMNLSIPLWFGEDEASMRLLRVRNESIPDFADFRKAIGPEWEQPARGVITWFPPRIFIQAITDKLPVLHKSASAVVKGWDGQIREETIHDLIVSNQTDLVSMIAENNLKFFTLPRVVIFHTGLYNDNEDEFKITYPSNLTLHSVRGMQKNYRFKSLVKSVYGYHSSAENDLIFENPAFDGYQPDILIYQQSGFQSDATKPVYHEKFNIHLTKISKHGVNIPGISVFQGSTNGEAKLKFNVRGDNINITLVD